MNLTKLFETQKVLRDRIGYEGEDRFEKLILALLVEIGECANEWRGFKFWSKDQKPRRELIHRDPHGQCADVVTNPLLEEYVDGLHFVLEIGLEIDYSTMPFNSNHGYERNTITQQFQLVFGLAYNMSEDDYFVQLIHAYIHLGEMLGFTWEEIETTYFQKNKMNHERQNTGY